MLLRLCEARLWLAAFVIGSTGEACLCKAHACDRLAVHPELAARPGLSTAPAGKPGSAPGDGARQEHSAPQRALPLRLPAQQPVLALLVIIVLDGRLPLQAFLALARGGGGARQGPAAGAPLQLVGFGLRLGCRGPTRLERQPGEDG